MANTSANYRIKLAGVIDTSTLNKQIKQINSSGSLKELKIKVDINEKSIAKVKELNDLLGKVQGLNDYTAALKNMREAMESYAKVATKTVNASQNISNAISKIGKESNNATPKVKTFSDKMADAVSKFSQWQVVGDIIHTVINAIKQLTDVVLELDIAYTELTKVTDLTANDFDRITDKAYDLGSEVAKTTTEVINAMTEFAKAGYSVNESTDILARNALMWTNIADGTVDAAEASNMMISVMKAFNIEAANSTKIIDALNEVSNNYAISSGQLSDSLTKSASVLAASGVSFEQQLGLVTARH